MKESTGSTTMEKANVRTVRVAAVQMSSQEGAIVANLQHAASLVEQAARGGAQLVLLPEFMPTGYLWEKRIWESAEPPEGQTVQWLRNTSARLSIWLGTSFLETNGKDFFNTFVLTTPEGKDAGRVRKQFPSVGEAFFFKGEPGSHVIETDLGRIGVAICFDAHTVRIARLMVEQNIDLMLIPHSFCIPAVLSDGAGSEDIERMKSNLREMAPYYARLLGVPAVAVNKCGPARTPKPEGFVFPGLAAITDSDGTIKKQLADEEGFIIETVTLDPSRKVYGVPRAYGRYIYPGPAGRAVFAVVELVGQLWYTFSRDRKTCAQKTMFLATTQHTTG